MVTPGYGHERFVEKLWGLGCVPLWVGNLPNAKFAVRKSPYGLVIPKLSGLDENWMYDKSPIEGLIKECVEYEVVRVGVIAMGRVVDEWESLSNKKTLIKVGGGDSDAFFASVVRFAVGRSNDFGRHLLT